MQKTSKSRRGFTIIEVVLFLAITGLMMAGILTAVGAGVNGKRYSEAVDSFHDFLISQYDKTNNVANSHEGNVTCRGDALPVGTSVCSVIGRLVTSSDGQSIVSTPLYASADVTSLDSDSFESPAQLLKDLNIYTSTEDPGDDQYQLRWQTEIRSQNGADIQPFTLMIVRLPYAKGSINYISERAVGSLDSQNVDEFIDQVTAPTSFEQLALCVEPNGLQTAPPVGLVVKNAGSGASSSIQREGDVCQ